MARETKVGMLVGLGFIICFAIILEHRGRDSEVAPLMPHQALTQAVPAQPTDTGTLAERRAKEYGQAHIPKPANRRTAPPDVAPPTRRQTTFQGDRSGTSPVSMPGRGQPERFTRQEPSVELPSQKPVEVPTRRQPPAPRSTPVLAEKETGAPTQPRLTATQSTTPPVNQARRGTPVTPGRRYVVKPGDSLSRIASQQYGTCAKRVIDAIYAANRSTMASPDSLGVGQEIVLPDIGGAKAPSATPRRTEQPKPAPALKARQDSPPAQPKYQFYQIEKGDCYATIAKKFLGSSSRWREIAELNKDVFPDPGKIRYGVRIRIPVEASSAQKDRD